MKSFIGFMYDRKPVLHMLEGVLEDLQLLVSEEEFKKVMVRWSFQEISENVRTRLEDLDKP